MQRYLQRKVIMKKITLPKITVSEVVKKQLRVIGYLVASWALALLLAEATKDVRYVGLAPVINILIVMVKQELSNEGYRQALKK